MENIWELDKKVQRYAKALHKDPSNVLLMMRYKKALNRLDEEIGKELC